MLFVGFLIDQNRQSSTIKSYISDIAAMLLSTGIELSEDRYLLSLLTKACKFMTDNVRVQFPIHKGLMLVILKKIRSIIYPQQPYLSKLYVAIISTSYYGLFRIGELTKGTHPILAKDVHIATNKKKLLFFLRMSKNHSKGNKPQQIKIKASGSSKKDDNCSFHILQQYLRIRKGYIALSEPFFVFRDRSPVMPENVRKILRQALAATNLDASLYNCHSLRIGRCHDLLELGVPVDTIRKLGRWANVNSVYTYLRC